MNQDCVYERMSVRLEGNRLYVQKDGVHVINISDRTTPRDLGLYSVLGMSLAVEDGTVFVAGLGGELSAFKAP